MNQSFDYFGMPELPYLILCNPNKEQLYALGVAYEMKVVQRFNAMSEFNFIFPESIDGGATLIEAYTYLENKRLVLVEGYGYFQIVNVEENRDGSIPIKAVSCMSIENELVSKRVVGFGGTVKLYDTLHPYGTILNTMITLAPSWSLGDIDGELMTKFRTFSVSDSNVYEFLMNDVAKAFECVFFFDIINKTISAKTLENATTSSDIFLSFDNVISTSKFSEKSDEIVTSLSVAGGGDLTIAGVNPFGVNIYDFSYYKNTNWMSSGLILAIDDWENTIAAYQPDYADFLFYLKEFNTELIDLQGDLDNLEAEYVALETVQKTRIEAGLPYADILVLMTQKRNAITAQEALVANKQYQIDSVRDELDSIISYVSFADNFTPTQLIELSNFIYQNTYKNENIIITDSMTSSEIQDKQEELYLQALTVLSRISQPRYEISIDSVNYLALPEFSTFTSQTEMGVEVTCELKDGQFITVVLLELSYTLDDPTNFTATFSNRLRLDGDGYTYSDLVGEVVRTGSDVAFNNTQWSNWSENYKDDVTTFINSSLNAAVNNLINNEHQEILIDVNGLRGRSFKANTQTYDSKQVWLTSSILAFTNDSWNTAKLALGNVTLPTGGTAYGLVADVIVGRLLAGNSLTITNQNNSFTLNGTGATLTNATFNITNTNSRIFLDPANGLRIQQNVGGTWTDRFSVTSGGNIVFSGSLSGASGTFSGTITASAGTIGALTINALGLQNASGTNYLRGNDLKWGALNITGSTATFSGTIFADKISGQVIDNQIATGLNASKVTFGQLTAIDIYGSRIAWDGVVMDTLGGGWATIQANRLSLTSTRAGGADLLLDDGIIVLQSGYGSSGTGAIVLQTNYGTLELNETYLYSNVSGDGGYAMSDTIRIQTSAGYRYFVFDNGLLINYYA